MYYPGAYYITDDTISACDRRHSTRRTMVLEVDQFDLESFRKSTWGGHLDWVAHFVEATLK